MTDHASPLARIVAALEVHARPGPTPVADEVQSLADDLDDLRAEYETQCEEMLNIRAMCQTALAGTEAKTWKEPAALVGYVCDRLAYVTAQSAQSAHSSIEAESPIRPNPEPNQSGATGETPR